MKPQSSNDRSRYRSVFVLGFAGGLLVMWAATMTLNVFEVVPSGAPIAAAIAGTVATVVAFATINHQAQVAFSISEKEKNQNLSKVAYECLPELYVRGRAQHEALEVLSDYFSGRNFGSEYIEVSEPAAETLLSNESLPDKSFRRILDSLWAVPEPGPRDIVGSYYRGDAFYSRAIENMFSAVRNERSLTRTEAWEAVHAMALDLIRSMKAIKSLTDLKLLYTDELLGDALFELKMLYGERDPSWVAEFNSGALDWERKWKLDIGYFVKHAVDSFHESPRVLGGRSALGDASV